MKTLLILILCSCCILVNAQTRKGTIIKGGRLVLLSDSTHCSNDTLSFKFTSFKVEIEGHIYTVWQYFDLREKTRFDKSKKVYLPN